MYISLFLASSADELIDPISEVFEPSNVTAVMSFERQASLIAASSVGYILGLDVLDPRDESSIRYSRRYILITIVQSKRPSSYFCEYYYQQSF